MTRTFLVLAAALALASPAARAQGTAPPGPSVEERLDRLERLKLSGYVQGRYEWHEDADFGLDANNRPRGTNRFLVRRARLKAAYAGDLSEFVLQIDAVGEGVALRDAEASLVLDHERLRAPGGTELKLTVGQFKVPFGFEILQSSSERELPERALVVRRLFPGERDRGLRLQGRSGWLRLQAALVNGNFINDPLYGTFDHTSWKDVIGRLGAETRYLSGGLSGHFGRILRTTPGRAASGTSPAVPASYERYERLRLGADVQGHYPIPSLGRLVLRGEVIWARDENIAFSGLPPDPCRDVSSFGWYVTAVQQLGARLGAVARLDQFDANRGVPGQCPEAVRALAGEDRVTTLGVGLFHDVSRHLRATLAYEHSAEQGAQARDNDVFTAQLQARF